MILKEIKYNVNVCLTVSEIRLIIQALHNDQAHQIRNDEIVKLEKSFKHALDLCDKIHI